MAIGEIVFFDVHACQITLVCGHGTPPIHCISTKMQQKVAYYNSIEDRMKVVAENSEYKMTSPLSSLFFLVLLAKLGRTKCNISNKYTFPCAFPKTSDKMVSTVP